MQRPSTILFIVLDAFPHDLVDRDLTPTLFALAAEGGWARDGGRGILSAATYPNHATFITGVGPGEHGVYTNRAWSAEGKRPAQEVGPRASTLFEECRAAGLKTAAAFGDQNLVGVCGAEKADVHWPPKGILPAGAPKGKLGYGADRAVIQGLDTLDLAGADFVFLQLDEVDTARHLSGPFGDAVLEQCRATDSALAEILERFRSEWDDTLAIVVSDHDHEAVEPGAVDLAAEATARGLDIEIDHEGTAALVVGEVSDARLLELPGVAGATGLAPGFKLVWGPPGQQFGIDWGLAAQHGSPRTLKQLAVVGGGHPAARAIAAEVEASPPSGLSWAGWMRHWLAL
jgi:predicted AlkP superfamily pyrophosphatase or phosphodiesterase